MADDFTTQEQALIERLEKAPQRRLTADAREVIRQRVLAQAVAAPVQYQRPRLNIKQFSIPTLIAASIVAISLAALVTRQYPNLISTPLSVTNPATIASTVPPATTTTSTVSATTVFNTTIPSTSSTPAAPAAFALEGIVQSVTGNVVIVNNTPVTLLTNTLTAKSIHVGDAIHIEGKIDSTGKLFASVIQAAGTTSTNTTVTVDGSVQSVNGNIVTVNGIQIQFPLDDPRLASIKVGDYLSIEGNFQKNGTATIMIMISVTAIAATEAPTVQTCPTVQPAMGMAAPPAMGPLDGMGPPPAMGMAAPPAMGPPDGMGMGDCN